MTWRPRFQDLLRSGWVGDFILDTAGPPSELKPSKTAAEPPMTSAPGELSDRPSAEDTGGAGGWGGGQGDSRQHGPLRLAPRALGEETPNYPQHNGRQPELKLIEAVTQSQPSQTFG